MLNPKDINPIDESNYDEIFEAPAPIRKWRWLKIISRIVFPPLLLWDGLKALTRLIISRQYNGKNLGHKILAAQKLDREKIREEFDATPFLKPPKKILVKTHDGAKLDTIEIEGENPYPEEKNDKIYVINFTGRTCCYEMLLDEMRYYTEEYQDHYDDQYQFVAIGFNYRSVIKSRGTLTSFDDTVIDGIAQVERLLKKNIDPKFINVKGHSLGGAVVVDVTTYFLNRGIHLGVVPDRPYHTFSSLIHAKDDIKDNKPPTLLNRIKSWLRHVYKKTALKLFNWESTPSDHYNEIPDQDREHFVVRSSPEERANGFKDDDMIPYEESFHFGQKGYRKKHKPPIKNSLQILQSLENPSPEQQAEIASLKKQLTKVTGHKIIGNPPNNQIDDRSCHHEHSLTKLFVRNRVDQSIRPAIDIAVDFYKARANR